MEKLDRHTIGEGDRLQVLKPSIAVQKERPREGAAASTLFTTITARSRTRHMGDHARARPIGRGRRG
jgi:hypothetical protein